MKTIILILALCASVRAEVGVSLYTNGTTKSAADAAYVNITGDTMTGPLTTTSLTASSVTVTGSAFSVGGSTLVVSGGTVSIGGGQVTTDITPCPSGMAYIPGPYPYCVDKYEAYLVSGAVSNDACTAGSQAEVDANATTAVAGSATGQTPLVSLNWCAAKKACQNAGKHLLTNSEWFNAANCKGSKWNITAEQSATCVTQEGVYDMIGNMWEWVDFVMTADPTNGLASNYVTGYDFATGIPTSIGAASAAYGNDYYWAYNGAGDARAVIRGGAWGDGADDGVFTFYASNAPSTVHTDIGFRCGRRK